MKWLQKQGSSEKNIPMLLLLAVGIIEFLFMILEGRFSGFGYYLTETYVMVPALLFLGYMLRDFHSGFARRRLLLSTAAVAWFVFSQMIHNLSDMDSQPITLVFTVYLMAFPFAALTDDRENAGIWMMGKLLLTGALVLVGYALLLLLNLVPEVWKDYIYWDGSRLLAFWHPNITACYLMVGMGFATVFLLRAKKPLAKVLLAVAVMVQFVAMALTNCRTTLLMTGALFGGVAFFCIFKGGWKRLILGLLAAALVLVGSFKLSGVIFQWNNDRLVAAYSASQTETAAVPEAAAIPEVVDAPAEEPAAAETVAIDAEGVLVSENVQGSFSEDLRTLNGRTVIWNSALQAVRDNKQLALWGTEYIGTVVSVYNPFPVEHGHNSWMEVLLRSGVPGLLLALVFTGLAVVSAAKLLLRKETELWKKMMAMTTICVMATGFLEPYLFGGKIFYHVIDFTFFFCTGYLDYWCRPKKYQ